MSLLNSFRAHGLAALLPLLTSISPATAQDPAPAVMLRYREVQNPGDLKFNLGDRAAARSVGEMAFEYPAGSFPIQGIDPALKTFCMEPMVPIYSGSIYPFSLETLTNQPQFFGLPQTEDGRTQAALRVLAIRELYGRYYQETLAKPQIAAAAFQTALWEVIHEPSPKPGQPGYNLFTGIFRADYPTEEGSPGFVQLAQKYVLSLTGDATSFGTNPALSGLELIRMTGLATPNSAAPQSQIGLRCTAPVATAEATSSASSPILGSSPMMTTGIPLMGGPGRMGPAAAAAGIGGPVVGGMGGGFPFFGQPFATTGTSSTSAETPSLLTSSTDLGSLTGASTQAPATSPTNTLPNAPLPPGTPNSPNVPTGTNPPGGTNPPTGPSGPNPNNPVPAPPAVVLGLIGIAVLAIRQRIRRA